MEEERKTNYTLFEGHDLPSQGKIYNKPVNKHIELRSMTARDEMKRLALSNTPLKTLADIIDGCLIEKPGIGVYDMCFGDYEFLLHKLRVVTYGPDYKVTVRCPHCNEIVDTTADLDALEVHGYDKETWESLQTFTLPKSNKVISLRPLTPRLEEEIEARTKEMSRRFKDAQFDFETLVRLTESIASVDGAELIRPDLENVINMLDAADLTKILNNMDKLNKSIGLDNRIYLTCPKCGEEFTNFFRFGPEFFRPSTL